MLVPKSYIEIVQRSGISDSISRAKKIKFDFSNSYLWNSSWSTLTDTGTITLPKNLYYRDDFNKLNFLNGSNVNIGGFSDNPLIKRGDYVKLYAGYRNMQPSSIRVSENLNLIAEGYVAKVYPTIPIRIDIEDSMWILKQTPMPTMVISDNDTLEDILKLICNTANNIHGTQLTYNTTTSTTFGQFQIGNESAAQLLNRLNSTYGFNAYFMGTELRCGILSYYPQNIKEHVFYLNGPKGNVPSEGNMLEWRRKDDIVLSAIAYNVVNESTGETTQDGHNKTTRKRLEVLVTYKNREFFSKIINNGERVPDNIEGDRRTFFFNNAKNYDELIDFAKKQLSKYRYDGLFGKFIAFGEPYVKHGDHVRLFNPAYEEQNGVYKVKSVEYTGVLSGIRQTIEIDYKV